ncbi:Assimilatory nitrate reductase large subunit [Paramagnetospirillum magnetotacticum MS-1]|uniref:Assimilatory nitrate reductase large subunit n=2 Tax=Paramagnetospirillum magnetotacticum TaxID=188 RepID=A0A0C2YC98_PARME|nr:Assimilatory nitrate reductase large subunit [Paramagnetospirillum magnetotacticum MS-1]
MPEIIRTTCPYCGVGCGVIAARLDQSAPWTVKGDPEHPANYGKLCVKGSALAETLDLDGRLLHPLISGNRASWDEALDLVAETFSTAVREHGPDSVAFYVSGQLLTEDYYAANKLMKGFIGSGNIDTNSRLCMSSTVAGHVRAFGSDTVPGCYEDLDLADLVVLVGSNAAWCHPVAFQRTLAAKARRPEMRIVVVDPRRTATAECADLHLAIRPGSDAILFNGLLAHLKGEETQLDVGVPLDQIVQFFSWFADTEKTVTVWSQGINQSSSGTDKVDAIINCHLQTGRIGRPGMGPFSLTGQPNAMGGREVGGLANMLAAHMGFDEASIDRVGRFWNATQMAGKPGLKAVDMFKAVAEGKIKALWIMCTNPAVSMPEADLVKSAIAACPFVVISECEANTDTARLAHVKLPALTWGEKDGTVTNSERRISRQRPFLPAPGEAKGDWWIITQVARRMGFGPAFAWNGPGEIFDEFCRLTAFENASTRDLDLSGLVGADYAAIEPIQWPVRAPGQGTARLFADGRFYHADGKARMLDITPRPPARAADLAFPLILNTGRMRDQWHTMTRTGRAARLAAHAPEPVLLVHPKDALRFRLSDGGLARVSGNRTSVVLRVALDPGQRIGEVFAPIHWNDQTASSAVIGSLIDAATDPHSGQPELKQAPVLVEPLEAAWHGVLLSRNPVDLPRSFYWAKASGAAHSIWRLAGEAGEDWPITAKQWLGTDGEWIEFLDPNRGHYRGARLVEGRLDAVLFVFPWAMDFSPDWVAAAFGRAAIAGDERATLVAGAPPGGDRGRDKTVCACFNVGLSAIRAAIRDHRLSSAAEVGAMLKAGTNCGSCVPEIRAILTEAAPKVA